MHCIRRKFLAAVESLSIALGRYRLLTAKRVGLRNGRIEVLK